MKTLLSLLLGGSLKFHLVDYPHDGKVKIIYEARDDSDGSFYAYEVDIALSHIITKRAVKFIFDTFTGV